MGSQPKNGKKTIICRSFRVVLLTLSFLGKRNAYQKNVVELRGAQNFRKSEYEVDVVTPQWGIMLSQFSNSEKNPLGMEASTCKQEVFNIFMI